MIILLNGPPRSGKDTIAEFISNKYGFIHYNFKEPLIQMVVKLFDIPRFLWDEKYITSKDIKMDFLRIYERKFSPREALIYVAEEMIKPVLGPSIFANVIANRINPNKNYVISDLGFKHEMDEVLAKLNSNGINNEMNDSINNNINIFRIYRDRCSFVNDSRNYIPIIKDINTSIIYNNGSIYDLEKKVEGMVDSIINKFNLDI